MGNAKMGQYTTYRTSDLYLAAWLLSNGLEFLDINRRNKQRNDFIYYLKKAKNLLYASQVEGD